MEVFNLCNILKKRCSS